MQLNNQFDFLNNVNEIFNKLSHTIKLDMNIDLNQFSKNNQIDYNEVESYLAQYDNINSKEIYQLKKSKLSFTKINKTRSNLATLSPFCYSQNGTTAFANIDHSFP